MIFFPAIDLKNSQCVRLVQGDMNQVTVFNTSPKEQALTFVNEGAKWIHVVDLNGAISGKPINADAIQSIINVIDIPIQLGGGIRDKETIDFWLERGVRRVILGTVAVKDPDLVKQACKDYPGRIAVGIDARDGFVAVEGWTESSKITALELGQKFDNYGVAAIIYTDIERDGVMKGPNLKATINLANAVSVPVIASGGVSSLEDLKSIKEAGDGILEGVISGRALYDGQIDLGHAVRLLESYVEG